MQAGSLQLSSGARGSRLPIRRHAARWASRAALAALLLVGVAVFGLGALRTLGYQTLVVSSGSMEPALGIGDLVVTRMAAPDDVRAGDVVTFKDPSRDGILVTHRVVRASVRGLVHEFVTKGDANTAVETWSVRDGARGIGVMAFSIPRVGLAFARLGAPSARIVLLGGGSLFVGLVLLKRIWGSGR